MPSVKVKPKTSQKLGSQLWCLIILSSGSWKLKTVDSLYESIEIKIFYYLKFNNEMNTGVQSIIIAIPFKMRWLQQYLWCHKYSKTFEVEDSEKEKREDHQGDCGVSKAAAEAGFLAED